MPQIAQVNNKRIAKNTLFLYIRMIFIMGVTLFTSRVILDKLGVTDYGLYNAVGGVVGMLEFLNGTLSTGTSRFITFELGANDKEQLISTFSTAFYIHLFLALIMAVILETLGLWFVYNKLVIPPERMSAVVWCFHISILTMVVSITQVPYTSDIIAHENMNVYAYLGIYEALAKLFIVYLLSISPWDKLVFYAILVALVQISVALSYRYFCKHRYLESKLKLIFKRDIFFKMLTFSGWSLIANLSEVLSKQGLVVLINLFFQPAVVAAQAIGNQISGAMMQFINNFRTAINPQIMKLYAAEKYKESRMLTLNSSIYVFDLLLFLGLPAIVLMEPLLNLWLVKVPVYAVVFAQYIVAQQILGNFNAAFYLPMMASGKLKENSYACVFVSILGFVILYFLLRAGLGVMWVQYIGLMQIILFSFIVKPYILYKKIGYPLRELLSCIFQSVKISIFPIFVSLLVYHLMDLRRFLAIILAALIIGGSVCISAYTFMDKETRLKLNGMIKEKLLKN